MRGPISLVLFCSDGATKQRFKESFQAGKYDVQIHLAQQPQDLKERIEQRLEVDFVLVATQSYDSRLELIRSIAAEDGKSLPPPPVFVLVKEIERDGTRLTTLLSAGADGVITEPLRVEAVEEAVQHMLESSKYKDFREHKTKAVLSVTLANTALMVDHLARLQLTGDPLTAELFRERPKMQKTTSALWDSSTPDEYAAALLSVCAARPPFIARVDSRRARRQKKALHPAKIVTRIMTTRGISPDKLAAAMRMDLEIVNQFLKEEVEMTEELAENFGRVLGHDKKYWLELCPGRTA